MEPVHTLDTFAGIQFDSYTPAAALLIPVLAQMDFGDPELNSAAQWLTQWSDYQSAARSPQAALFSVFWTRLMHLALDELPIYEGAHALYLMSNMLNGLHPLWANTERGYGFGSRDQVLGDALRETLDWMNQQFGTTRDQWNWGNLHMTHFTTLLPEQFETSGLFDRQVPTDGGWGTVNTSEWDIASENYSVTKIPSMRMILDVSDFDRSLYINSTGESGDPRNPHYDDMISIWQNGGYQGTSTTVTTLVIHP
jgi:penicillin amidase